MVNDILSMVNSSLTGYANAIAQTSNQQLRQMLQQTRDADEQFQYKLCQIAEQKGYYQPAQPAEPTGYTAGACISYTKLICLSL